MKTKLIATVLIGLFIFLALRFSLFNSLKEFPGIEMDEGRPPILCPLHHVLGSPWGIPYFTVPKGDEHEIVL